MAQTQTLTRSSHVDIFSHNKKTTTTAAAVAAVAAVKSIESTTFGISCCCTALDLSLNEET